METIIELPYDLDFGAEDGQDESPLGGTIRMSVGPEDLNDLWADLDQALQLSSRA